jgi:hypothetical protein
MRSSNKTVSFSKPFTLKGLDGPQPAGDYVVVTAEQRVATTLFEAWRRVDTQIRLPSLQGYAGVEQYTSIAPGELEDALRSDRSSPEVAPSARIHD